jgi:hypothetical protein
MTLDILAEIAVGLLFAWLVISIATTYIQEWVVRWLKWRSSMLEDAIRNMLGDAEMTAQFYNHPIIRGLHSGKEWANKPSYLPAQQFALALFDMVKTAGTEGSLIQKHLFGVRTQLQKLEVEQKTLRGRLFKTSKLDAKAAIQEMDHLINMARYAASTDIGEALVKTKLAELKLEINEFTKKYPQFKGEIDLAVTLAEQKALEALKLKESATGQQMNSDNPSLAELRYGLVMLTATNPDLKQAISGLIEGVEHTVRENENEIMLARQSVEKWFDSSMDRVSGWYKRETQKSALIIGLVLALVMNIDTIQLASQLWEQPALRQALSEQAAIYVNEQNGGVQNYTPSADDLKKFQLEFSSINMPMGWLGTAYPVNAQNQMIDSTGGVIKTCSWNPTTITNDYGFVANGMCYPIINAPLYNDLTGIILKLFGLFLTGMVAGQGAPFWFDILKNIINLRSSGLLSSGTAPKEEKEK